MNRMFKLSVDMKSNYFHIGLIGLLLIGFFFYFYSLTHPACCDASYYVTLAREINESGIGGYNDQVRTWGYPWVLSLLIVVSDFINIPLDFFVFTFQLALYYFAILYMYNCSVFFNKKAASAVYLLLCFNVFAIPYAATTLTDSLYLTLSLVFFAQIFNLASKLEKVDFDSSNVLAAMLFVVCINIAIRPAAIWMVIPLLCLVLYCLFTKKLDILKFATLSIFASLPIIVQLAINTIHFGQHTFLPVVDLGGLQIKWGIEYIKYGTWLGGGPPQNYYPSTNLIDNAQSDIGLIWYLHNFIDGIKLLFVKFIGAFDFDFLVPYAYSKPYIAYAPSLFAYTLLWVGLSMTVGVLFSNRARELKFRFLPLIILLSWGATALSSALELRFTLPILVYFMILTPLFYEWFFKENTLKFKVIYLCGGAVFVTMCGFVAAFVRSQSSVLPYM